MSFPIQCFSCGNQFTTLRVTASLRCGRCNSTDLDLIDEVKTASQGGTGWNESRPDRLKGWNEYQGPLPQGNPHRVNETVAEAAPDGSIVCPACKGTGYNDRASGGGYDEVSCRNCHGTGRANPPTSRPPVQQNTNAPRPQVGGAGWTASKGTKVKINIGGKVYEGSISAESGRKSSDPLGSPENYLRGTYSHPESTNYRPPTKPVSHGNNGLPLPGASCPECSGSSTSLVRDANDDAWWHCPNCGPLANVDKHPDVNPFAPPETLPPNRKMKTAKAEGQLPGTLLRRVQATVAMNPGLTLKGAVTLSLAATKVEKEAEK